MLEEPTFKRVAYRNGVAVDVSKAVRGIICFKAINGKRYQAVYLVSDLKKKLKGIPPTQRVVGLTIDSCKIQLTVKELRDLLQV